MTSVPWGPWNGWSWYWLILNSAWVVGFFYGEFFNLTRGQVGNTFSAQIWRMESFVPGQSVWSWSAVHFLVAATIGILLLWLLGHFVLGIWL